MFNRKPLHFSGWETDKDLRLFKKDKAKYKSEKLVHETMDVNGSIGILKNRLIHYSYDDYEGYKEKMVNYAKLRAKELWLMNVRPNYYHLYMKPTYKFIYDYIFRLGFLDGIKGITICHLNALSVYVRYQELKKLMKQNLPY